MFKFNILELIYPNVCGMCGKVNKESICEKCLVNLNKIQINAKLNVKNNIKKYFDYGIGIFKYEKIIRTKIIDYKFNDKAYLYKTFSKIILKNKKTYRILKNYDIIIPVPVHKKRKNQRGYNQTELIAKEIAKNVPSLIFLKNILIKQKNTISQTMLTRNKRQENVKDAFFLKNSETIKDKKVILFDDIYTTGSTINECSKLLKQAQVKSIYIITIAKD